jgi:hypothetical protein
MAKKSEKFYVEKEGYYYCESALEDDKQIILHTQYESTVNTEKLILEYRYFIQDSNNGVKKILGIVPNYKKGDIKK